MKIRTGDNHADERLEETCFHLMLRLDSRLAGESFEIVPAQGAVTINAGNELGLLQGAGKFLRTCRYTPQGVTPGAEPVSVAISPSVIRGMYFATHFHNFYHDAPINEVISYIEDLALWGMNTLEAWFDMHHYTGIDDPAAQSMLGRLRQIFAAAKELGVRCCLTQLGNEAYADSPPSMRADYNTNRSIYHVELCPHKAGATELMLSWFDELLDAFAAVVPDYIVFGPYDQGGCACEQCSPWGANGYLKIVEAKVRQMRKRFPDTKVILHTWLFDLESDQGEWSGLASAFAERPDWCDYIQADSHTTFPEFPLQNGVPGNLPLLNFPEISMWMMHPWGGFGANPLPRRFEELQRPIKDHISGGFPYSEGIYEDINKVLWLQWYGDAGRTADEITREYIGYEFSPYVVDEVMEAIFILEANQNHIWLYEPPSSDWPRPRHTRSAMDFERDPQRALQLMQQADSKLPEAAKKSWRWRILYLRALLDSRLQATRGFWGDEECEQAFRELTAIYHAQGAEYKCAPPTRESIAACLSSENSVRAH